MVDIASRYKDVEPLRSKDSGEVAAAFERIYSRTLDWPKLLQVGPGREFMGRVSPLFANHGTKFRRSEAGNHRAQSIVERANRTWLSHQYAQEMVRAFAAGKAAERSRTWVIRLPAVLKAMNGEVTRLIGKAPSKVVEETAVEIVTPSYQRPVGFAEERLSHFALVRYLYAPGELEGGEKRRATDPVWSLEMYDISRSLVSKDQPVLYYLADAPVRRGFVREELLVMPPDTELRDSVVK